MSTHTTEISSCDTRETTSLLGILPSGELQQIHAAYRLDESNYLKWSQLIQTILKGKGKISHITGTGPTKEDPAYVAWDKEDSMIIAWLWSSMAPEISDIYMFHNQGSLGVYSTNLFKS